MSSAEMGPPPVPPKPVIDRIMREEGRKTLVRSLAAVQKSWLELALPSRRTGAYMRSIHPVITPLGSIGWSGQVVADSPYAEALEEGTGIYGPRNEPIVARSGGVLRFPSPGDARFTLSGRQRAGRRGQGAQWVFARSVRGMRGRHYGRDAVLKAQGEVDREVAVGAERIAARLAAASVR